MMSPEPGWGVSVVIATHSSKRWDQLIDAIDSVKAQLPAPSAIVIAVDHNAELSARIEQEVPGVVVALNESVHRGASATRNCGAGATTTDLVAFLDDDEIAEPEWLSLLVAPFEDPDVVGTGGRYVPNWERRRPPWFPDELAWVVGAHHSGMPTERAAVRNVWSGNMAVRKSAFDSVGGFRAGFGKTATQSRPEDTDLCIRMSASGGTWIYLPEARIHHHVPADRATFAFFVRRSYAEGRGKVDLGDEHSGQDALATERAYLRTTIPRGVATHVVDAASGLGRAGSICVGIAAAGLGGAVSAVSIRKLRWRASRAGRRNR